MPGKFDDPFWRWRAVCAPSDASGAEGDDPSGGAEPEAELPAPDDAEGADGASASGAQASEAGDGAEPQAKEKPWFTQRIDRLTREKHEAIRQRDEMAAQLRQIQTNAQRQASQEVEQAVQQSGRPAPTQEQFDYMVAQRAAAIAQAESFHTRCNEIYEQGVKKEGFKESLGVLQSNFGQFDPSTGQLILPYDFLQMVIDTDDPVQVLTRLGKNPELAEEVFNTRNPVSRATKLAKLALGGTAGKVSNAPPPVRGQVGGNSGTAAKRLDDPNLPLDEWMRLRDKQVADRRASR